MSDCWIQTYKGKKFDFLYPHDQEYVIEDIAHSLSNICRFNGHTKTFYSVAQHSVLVSWRVPAEHKLCGLLHDSHEAYTGDPMRPFKGAMQGSIYPGICKEIERAIANSFKFTWPMPKEVKEADNRILMTECRDLMGGEQGGKWSVNKEPYEEEIMPWSPEYAEKSFLKWFRVFTTAGDGKIK